MLRDCPYNMAIVYYQLFLGGVLRIAWASEPGKQRACPGLHLQNWRQGSVQRLTRRGRLKESQKWGKTALAEGRRLPLAQQAAVEWETGQGASFPGDELIRPLPLSDPRGRGLYVCVCVCVHARALLFNTYLGLQNFPAKKQLCSNFMAAVTLCSDFRA